MTKQHRQLLIVYNADSGILNAIAHAIHKQLAPETYPCSLCALTYGMVSMKNEWRDFLDQLPLEAVFHHKDDFEDAFPGHGHDLPAILTREGGEAPELLVPPTELDAMERLSDLIVRVTELLEIESQRRPSLKVVA